MKNDSELVSVLLAACMDRQPSLAQVNADLKAAFLKQGSETEDNLNCLEHVEYGICATVVYGNPKVYGLKIKGKEILLSYIVNALEEIEIPVRITEEYPDVSDAEWRAVLRMATMLLISLECSQGEISI